MVESWLKEKGDSVSSSTLSSTIKAVVQLGKETMIYRVFPSAEYPPHGFFPSVHTPEGLPRGSSVTANSDTSRPCLSATRQASGPVPPAVTIRGESSPGI